MRSNSWVRRLEQWTGYFAFQEQAKAPRADVAYGWWYAAILAASILIILVRMPEMILDPRFFAEDGRIFYQDAHNLGPLTSIVTPYAGYFHLLPRLIASASLILPIVHAPLFFSLTALTITGITLSWFFLPHFRTVVANDWIRLAVVGLFLSTPNIESLMVIAYLQWYVAVWCVLVTLMSPPRRRWLQWLIAVAYMVAIATAPVVIVLAPIWLLRFYRARPFQRIWIGCILLSQALMVWFTLRLPQQMPTLFLLDKLLLDLWRAFSYKVMVLTLVGDVGAEWLLLQAGWWGIYALAGAIIIGMILLAVYNYKGPKVWMLSLILGYIVLATTMVYAHRASHHSFVFASATDFVTRWHSRYFLLGSVGLYLFFALHADNVMRSSDRIRLRGTLAALLLAVLIGHVATFRLPMFGVGNWHRFGVWLDTAVSEPQSLLRRVTLTTNTGTSEKTEPKQQDFQLYLPVVTTTDQVALGRNQLAIPIPPAGWCMTLVNRANPPATVQFPSSFTLVSAQSRVEQDHVLLDFLWTRTRHIPVQDQTIWFAIVDADEQTYLLHSDALAAPIEEHCFPRLFASRHLLPLPQAMPSGTFDLRVSLTAPGTPVTGAAVTAHFPAVVKLNR